MKEDSTVGRNAYIIGFLQNFTPGTKTAINQKVLDIFLTRFWILIRPDIRENDLPYTKSTIN
jgi:hypothetical protein